LKELIDLLSTISAAKINKYSAVPTDGIITEADTKQELITNTSSNKSSTQRAQTSANAKISTESDTGFESGFSD